MFYVESHVVIESIRLLCTCRFADSAATGKSNAWKSNEDVFVALVFAQITIGETAKYSTHRADNTSHHATFSNYHYHLHVQHMI